MSSKGLRVIYYINIFYMLLGMITIAASSIIFLTICILLLLLELYILKYWNEKGLLLIDAKVTNSRFMQFNSRTFTSGYRYKIEYSIDEKKYKGIVYDFIPKKESPKEYIQIKVLKNNPIFYFDKNHENIYDFQIIYLLVVIGGVIYDSKIPFDIVITVILPVLLISFILYYLWDSL